MADNEDVDDQRVDSAGLDVGSGSQCFSLDEDWVRYLATAEIPSNVTGVDVSIADFTSEGPAIV